MNAADSEKKIVAVIVEGASEIRCLKPVLSSLYDKMRPSYRVEFPFMEEDGSKVWGDFTSKNGIKPANIFGCMNKLYIKPLLRRNGNLSPDCIKEIVHIIDMDGAYIDDSKIEENPASAHFIYKTNKLLVPNVNAAIERNEKKRANIDYLCARNSVFIKTGLGMDEKTFQIPYSIYFFSSNLDHVLHGDANIASGFEKVKLAEALAGKYEDAPETFLTAIESLSGTLVNASYEESWRYIRERGDNSLHPHTNINLLLKKIINERGNLDYEK